MNPMKTTRIILLIAISFGFPLAARTEESLIRREWKVDGATRQALVHVPNSAKTNAAPVVFAFHGHGGSMHNAARMFGYHLVWPDAIVVYMQGLNTPGQLTDPEGKKPGWQKAIGDQDDRDLKFFDAVLASLKNDYRVDKQRIYSTGHSNGGGFTYLLWAARGEQFAAFAPSASLSRALVDPTKNSSGIVRASRKSDQSKAWVEKVPSDLTNRAFLPKPVLHIAGENDPLVKFAWQKLMVDAVREKNQCAEGRPWRADQRCTIYPSKVNAPVVIYFHPGTHQFPAEAPALIVKFFKEHTNPPKK